MSDTPFGEKSLRLTVKNLLKEKKCKESVEEYLACIDMLKNILRTGEVKTKAMRDIIYGAIASFNDHVDLGIITGGKFSPIDPHMGARHNIKANDFISGNQYPVLKEPRAKAILQYPITSKLPVDCIWDRASKSVMHLKFYYKRNPGELLGLEKDEIVRLGLIDFFRDIFHTL